MKSSFEASSSEHVGVMAEVRALLEAVEEPYILLYEDGGGVRVVENCEGQADYLACLTSALMVAGDACGSREERLAFGAWLAKFIRRYALAGEEWCRGA